MVQAHTDVIKSLNQIDNSKAQCEADIRKCQKEINLAIAALDSFKEVGRNMITYNFFIILIN